MNYRYQLTNIDNLEFVDYSRNLKPPNDYNDWAAIDNGGIADFSQWTIDDLVIPETSMIHSGITMKQAEVAKKMVPSERSEEVASFTIIGKGLYTTREQVK